MLYTCYDLQEDLFNLYYHAMKRALQFIITFAILGIVLTRIDVSALIAHLRTVQVHLLVASTFCIIGQIMCLSLRWRAYLNFKHTVATFRESLVMNVAAHVANIVFVSSAGGIIAKSALAFRQGLTTTEAVIVTFLDRFMTLLALTLLSLMGLPFLLHVLGQEMAFVTGCSIAVIVVIIMVVLLWINTEQAKNLLKSSHKLSQGAKTLLPYLKNFALMRNTTFYSLVAQGFFILSVYILSTGIDKTNVTVSSLELVAVVPVLALLASLPISIGGWGVREGAFVYGLGLMGFSPESALLLSVQVGLVGYVAPLLVSIPCAFDHSWKRIFMTSTHPEKIK